jgi:VCBS repeat-containing protein
VYSSVSHVLGDNIENLYLTGFDDISGDGNALDNLIFGNGGFNDLQGYEGNDVIEGNGGGDGLYGDEGNDVLRGGDSDDYLGGGAGDDLLDGGADGDEMAGGAGNDTYYIDSENDTVFEVTGEGVDKVFERIWYYQMGGSIENATMLGDFQDINDFDARTIEGNALDNIITGNDGANWLAGYGGADTIDGRARDDEIYGGEGGDLIYGGDDAIRYEPQYIDSYGDLYSWNGGDFKLSTVNRSELASNSDFLDGGAGDDSIDAGSGDDRLYGEEGDDFLYGGDDGLVADSAEFGGGNEEEGGGGTDETDDGRVFLTNNDYLSGGAGKDVLDGGSGNDDLYGGAGDDTLYGGTDGPLNRNGRDYLDGGAGIDTMAGGTYDDTYVVDGFFYLTTDIEVYDDCGELVPGAVTRVWTTDTVFENSDEGYDRVYSYADYTLPENVEQLDLAWGSDARIGRGNAGDNRIIGNDFDNRLEGGAGNDELYGSYGNDVLDGGAGDDTLVGEAGANVYNFGARYGHDTVYSYGGGFDSVHLLQDIAASELTLTRQGNDVVIGLAGSGDRMVLANWFGRTDRVRQIVFCDDPAWDEATIAALANGRIDPVSAHDDIALVVEDAALVSTGNVLDNDVTTDAPLAVGNAGTYAGAYGTLELSADGSFTYTLDNDAAQVQAVAQGENFQEYFGYEAVGGFGAYADAALVVEVAGANDAPVFGPGTTGTVVEDAGGLVRYADGNVLFNGGFYFGLYEWELDGNAAYAGWDLLAWEGPTAAYFGAIGSPALLSQDVEVFEGGRYLLEFDLLGGAPDGAEFSVSWNGATLLSLNNTGLENEYRHYQVALDGVEGISRLEFSLRNDPGYWHLDDVRLGLLVEFENPPEFQQTSGALGFSDVDYSDWHVLSVQPRDENPLGSFDATITSDSAYGEAGSVVWNFSVANGDLQFLAEGETREQVYDLTLEDGYGGTATQSVTVTLRGVNDLPEAENDWIALQEDGVVAVSGNALDNDFDLDLADELSVVERGSFAGLYGTLDLAADGSFTYTLHNDSNTVQALNAGELVEDVFEYAVTDGLAFNLPQLFVEIEGVNDAPVAQDDAATVEEDAVLFAQGNVLANDSDADAGSLIVVSTPGVYAGAFGSLTLGADGSYVYALDHAAAQPLARGQEMQEVFAYDVTDGLETATAALTVSVNGANDAPTTEDLLAIVSEDGPGVTLTPVYGDADAGSVQLLAVGAFSNAGFELGGFVGWQLSDAALGEVLSGGAPLGAYYASLRSGAGQDAYTVLSRNFTLAAGESISGFAEFITGDALPFDDNGYVSVRLLGGASTPLIGASVATVGDYGSSGWMPFEFAAPETGTYVLEAGVRNTQDNSIDSRLLLDGMEHFGPAVGVTINADGTFDYDPGGRFEWLAEGEFATDSFSYTVTDNHGAQAVATAMVQVVGANDAPEIGAAQTAAGVTEENTLPAATVLGAQGAIAFSDVDLSDVHEVQVGTLDSGYLGEFAAQLSVDSTGGVGGSVRWSFSIENGALDAMGEGEFLEQSYEVLVDDGHGGIAQRIVTVTLNGANDAPVALIDAVGVQEDGTLGATGNVLGNDSDVDTNDVLSVANPGTYTRSYGTLTLLADGSYSYALDNDTAQSLAQGQEVQEVFGYATTDGIASTAANLTVTISGANDAPVTEDDAANVKEDGVTTASGNVLANDSDVDSGTTLTVANAGRYGSLDLSGDGNYTYTLDNSSAAVQGLRAGEVVTDSFAYLASDGWESTPGTLTVSVAGSNDDPLAHADAGAAQEDAGPVTLPGSALLANDTDADFDDTKSLLAVTNSAAGAQVTLVGGSVIYNVGGLYQTLKAGATAADSFSYTMVDAAGAASTATVAMTITGVNDAPMLVTPIADQNAAAGTAFNFAFAPNTFNDIDMGDTLAYSASLADGTALPSWLAFDAALRTFSGTPPGGTGGGTGEDCGCGTVVGGAPETLQLRVTATDTTGASANDVFVLNIAGGSSGGGIVPVVGTNHDDAIAGTSGNDVIDGRKGYDKMSGGAGDDAYFVDRNGSRVDLVIEGAVAGYDTVYSEADYTLPSNVEELHLIGNEELEGRGNALANMLIGNSGDNRLYGMAGNDLLLDDAGEDQLDGGDGDDVLDGGAGNDALTGGKGNDLFVHAKGGGHDLVQDSGGQDAIRFGYGIAAGDVTVRRVEGDLVLRLSVDGGSVTVKDWFSSSSKRIEQVQFADGTVWNESAIRARVTSGSDGEQGGHAAYYDDGQSGCGSGERSNGHEDDHDDDHHGGHDDNEERSGLFDAIAARLKRSADYDFTALAVYLQRQGGGGYGAMTPEQIAQRWVQVQNCVGSLARAEGDCGDGYGGKGHYGGYGCDDDRSHGGWGYSGSTGQSSGCGGMGTFSGLGEGFQKL